MSPIGTQHSLVEPALNGRASLNNADVLAGLPALDTLCIGSLPDLRGLLLAPTLECLVLLNVDAPLDLSPLRHDRIRWLGLMAGEACLPQGVHALSALPGLPCFSRIST